MIGNLYPEIKNSLWSLFGSPGRSITYIEGNAQVMNVIIVWKPGCLENQCCPNYGGSNMRYSGKTQKKPISGEEEWPKILFDRESAKIQTGKWIV